LDVNRPKLGQVSKKQGISWTGSNMYIVYKRRRILKYGNIWTDLSKAGIHGPVL
jgi:hypothetical protein